MNQFQNQTISGQTILLPDKGMNYLGHNLILENCTLIIETSAKGLVIAKTQFIDCEIIARKKLTNFRWHSTDLIRCKFEGIFSGNDFGFRENHVHPMGK